MFRTISKYGIKYGIPVAFMVFLLLVIISCGDQPETPMEENAAPPKPKFHMGLIPEQNLFSQKERYTPLARYISEMAGIDIELDILSRYGNIMENFTTNHLDGAFFGSFTGALAIMKLKVEPLARPVWLDGTSTYYGMVFTRKDSRIQNAGDMRGKTFAFVDKATTAGWLLPIHYFHELGIRDYRVWFGEIYFTGTHEDAIMDVLEGRADIGAAKNTIFYRLADNDSRVLDELRILTESPKVPSNTLCVRKDLDDSLKSKLKSILLSMHEDKEGREILRKFGAKRFIATTARDYEPVFNYADRIRLDLKNYEYRNN